MDANGWLCKSGMNHVSVSGKVLYTVCRRFVYGFVEMLHFMLSMTILYGYNFVPRI